MSLAHARSIDGHHPLLAEVLADLACKPKRVASTWLYDERGAELFEEICTLPEYYPTRTELAIMRGHATEMAALLGPGATLIEFGSGAGMKTRILLDHVAEPANYVPIDIAQTQLFEVASEIARDYPNLCVRPVCADFTQPFVLPDTVAHATRKVIYFPGSTIGNFEPDQAVRLLRRMRHLAGKDGMLLMGVDLKKDLTLLEHAYNDSRGVTAAFNLNVLRNLNRELGANFNPHNFRHRACWNEAHSRMEMHLASLTAQTVKIDVTQLHFEAGESLVTEYSHKYTLESFARLAGRADVAVAKVWMDAQQFFSVQLLQPK